LLINDKGSFTEEGFHNAVDEAIRDEPVEKGVKRKRTSEDKDQETKVKELLQRCGIDIPKKLILEQINTFIGNYEIVLDRKALKQQKINAIFETFREEIDEEIKVPDSKRRKVLFQSARGRGRGRGRPKGVQQKQTQSTSTNLIDNLNQKQNYK
jgi:hypothetical protein